MVKSRSYIATPPGATIKEQLADRGMSQKEFAIRMDLSEKHVSRLLNGVVQLTPEVAVRLETVLGVPASFWNKLEAIYQEKLIKAKAENKMNEDIELMKRFPYEEMAELGWIPETEEEKEKVDFLRRFFGVVSLSLLENAQITRIACKRLRVTENPDLASLAWTQEARIQARDISVSSVDEKGLLAALPAIRDLGGAESEEVRLKLKNVLEPYGIALVFLPPLKGTSMQGATFLDGKKIVIALLKEYENEERLWFSLFHELAHIVLGHIWGKNGTTDQDEETADLWAEAMLNGAA